MNKISTKKVKEKLERDKDSVSDLLLLLTNLMQEMDEQLTKLNLKQVERLGSILQGFMGAMDCFQRPILDLANEEANLICEICGYCMEEQIGIFYCMNCKNTIVQEEK